MQPKVYGIRIDKLLSELLDRIFKEIQPEPHFLSKPGMLNAIALASSALAQIPQEYITKERIDPRVEEALRFLRSNTNVDIKVQEIADECGMSLSAFTRLFKSETGQSPYQYLTDLRMNWACEILLSGNSPMEKIAEMIGYHDRFHFSKTFKRKIGITPAEYRRRGQKL